MLYPTRGPYQRTLVVGTCVERACKCKLSGNMGVQCSPCPDVVARSLHRHSVIHETPCYHSQHMQGQRVPTQPRGPIWDRLGNSAASIYCIYAPGQRFQFQRTKQCNSLNPELSMPQLLTGLMAVLVWTCDWLKPGQTGAVNMMLPSLTGNLWICGKSA